MYRLPDDDPAGIETCRTFSILTFWRRNYFFLFLAHPVYKMWIIQ